MSKKENKRIFIGLGTNLDDKKENLMNAISEIEKRADIIASSPIYETEPFGVTEQPHFYNCVIEIKTSLSAEELLQALHSIETKMGRVRTIHHGPRIIDLDILYYGDIVLKKGELIIPHPGAAVRPTVLVPLHTIAPEFVDPVLHKNVEELFLLLHPSEKEKLISLDIF